MSAEGMSGADFYSLGKRHLSGKGVPADKKLAFEYLLKAAELGYPEAQYDIGNLYDHGIFVAKDEKIALSWYEKSAKQGNAQAQYNLGVYYSKGIVVEKDFKKAFEWYSKSASQGYILATYNLALAYYQGNGVKQDDVKAVSLLEKCAIRGFDIAQYNLASILYGSGKNKSLVTAYVWFKVYLNQGGEEYAKYAKKGIEGIVQKLDKKSLDDAEKLYLITVDKVKQHAENRPLFEGKPQIIN
jgi:TPR repeat protein